MKPMKNNMTTPIYDFVKSYAEKNGVRFHMPGHKGNGILGCEAYDITEISGADSLFEAHSIIAESERNLSDIYNTRSSFYSTEGSSLCIRAMLFCAMQYSNSKKVLAGRNAHKAFMSALALLDLDADWLYGDDLYTCNITPEMLALALSKEDYLAVYVTSPDYLGNMLDIFALSNICRKHNIPLVVDNAHGAYLKFTGNHPIDLGADMCCDSAHKTLPCLTGAAYLHVSKTALHPYENDVKRAMSLFASTSPSYLIMASMDLANIVMSKDCQIKLYAVSQKVDELKTELSHLGIDFSGNEKLKVNIKPKSFGYLGTELAELLQEHEIYVEFCDKDNLVLMFSQDNRVEDFQKLTGVLKSLKAKPPITSMPPIPPRAKKVMSVRQAAFSKQEWVKSELAVGRILASPCVSCPPAIPVAACGEMLDTSALECFVYYGVEKVMCVVE